MFGWGLAVLNGLAGLHAGRREQQMRDALARHRLRPLESITVPAGTGGEGGTATLTATPRTPSRNCHGCGSPDFVSTATGYRCAYCRRRP